MKKIEFFFLLLLVLGAFFVRLYRFNGPIADWHSWRQADTAAVSRNFVKYGFDLLHPRIDNISNVQTDGRYENPKGYFFAEFPLYNAASAGLFVLFHFFTIEEWGRLVAIVSSLFSLVFIYLLTKKYASQTAGFFAAFLYAFLPFAIYYSRTILPGASSDAALLGSLYTYDSALFTKSKWKATSLFICSIILASVAILIRPFALFFLLPYVYISYQRWGWKFLKKFQLYLYVFLAILPFALWRLWMLAYPEGIPSSAWLFNGGNIRFTGAFFYWLFADRLSRLILGYWGIILLVLGIIWKRKHSGFFLSFLLSSLLYLVVIAKGNVQHDYYQYAIIPSVVMLCGLGAESLFFGSEHINKILSRTILGICLLASIAFGWYNIRDYFNINNPNIIIAGKAVDALTPKDAKIVTFYDGDSTFLYQTNRVGWASLEKSLAELIRMGASYLVIVNPTANDLSGFGKQYKVVASSNAYLLLDLIHTK